MKNALSSNLRVHIVPVGFDVAERITKPLVQFRADKVYLVTRGRDDHASTNMKQVRKILQNHSHIQIKDIYVNIWDLFSCLEKFREVFEAEKGNHLYVNVSTGSKIVSIAGMIASMLWKGTPYYAMLDYEDTGPAASPEKRQVKDIDFLPVYEINKPTPESLQVLHVIEAKKGKTTKKELIEELQALKMIPTYGPSQPRSAPHSRLRAIIGPLEDHWHFVDVRARGRKSEVSLTEQGERALRIFGAGTSQMKI